MHNDKIVFFSSGVGGKGIDILRPASNQGSQPQAEKE